MFGLSCFGCACVACFFRGGVGGDTGRAVFCFIYFSCVCVVYVFFWGRGCFFSGGGGGEKLVETKTSVRAWPIVKYISCISLAQRLRS